MQKDETKTIEFGENPKLNPDSPATARQKLLLKMAIRKDLLHPNPFESGNYQKWESLTAGEADQLLSSIPPERLGVLEKKVNEMTAPRRSHPLAERVGRCAEEMIREIGRGIDGGF